MDNLNDFINTLIETHTNLDRVSRIADRAKHSLPGDVYMDLFEQLTNLRNSIAELTAADIDRYLGQSRDTFVAPTGSPHTAHPATPTHDTPSDTHDTATKLAQIATPKAIKPDQPIDRPIDNNIDSTKDSTIDSHVDSNTDSTKDSHADSKASSSKASNDATNDADDSATNKVTSAKAKVADKSDADVFDTDVSLSSIEDGSYAAKLAEQANKSDAAKAKQEQLVAKGKAQLDDYMKKLKDTSTHDKQHVNDTISKQISDQLGDTKSAAKSDTKSDKASDTKSAAKSDEKSDTKSDEKPTKKSNESLFDDENDDDDLFGKSAGKDGTLDFD